jgi:DNA-binding NtrC family response regulator
MQNSSRKIKTGHDGPSNPSAPIVIVDDIRTNLLFLENCLKKAGYTNTLACRESSRVIDILSEHPSEIILLDLRMPDPDGITLLPMIRENFPDLPVIIVTDVGDVTTAVQCMREGAYDYITKPVDQGLFQVTVDRAVAFRKLQRENRELKKTASGFEDLENPAAFSGIVTASPLMLKVFRYSESVAKTREPVLITGETGTGKEKAAQAIHSLGGTNGKMITVNVAGLDDSMFADTLFGHVRGAFTGADSPRKGLIESAEGGTLFLDEIGDLSPSSQVKLLRLLQEGEYMAIGSDSVKTSGARIIVATNKDLWSLEKMGLFRKDLIYRLKTHHIHLPCLSDRRGDIPLLVNHFVREACERYNRGIPVIASDLPVRLESFPFQGNVRELKSMVFDAVSRCEDRLDDSHFSPHFQQGLSPGRSMKNGGSCHPETTVFPDPLPTIREITESLVMEAMKRAGGKQTLAASMLGISQPALNKRLKK